MSGKTLSEEIKTQILKFDEDDEISVMMPGKRNSVSIRNSEGVKGHVLTDKTSFG